MGGQIPIFNDAFQSPTDEYNPQLAKRPFVFNILAPDMVTSILPDEYALVLHVNPQSVTPTYAKNIIRIPTRGGFVEQHWGDAARSLDFNMVTGGFMRLYSGLSNITGGDGATSVGGTRRETLAYDRYLDMLALFHHNASVYDLTGKIVFQGIISCHFDGGTYYGWFGNFTVEETTEKPYMFNLTANFLIDHEIQTFNTVVPVPGGSI